MHHRFSDHEKYCGVGKQISANSVDVEDDILHYVLDIADLEGKQNPSNNPIVTITIIVFSSRHHFGVQIFVKFPGLPPPPLFLAPPL